MLNPPPAFADLEGLIDLDRIAQDGMRVRASAGASSVCV